VLSEFLTQGAQAGDVAIALNRVAVGGFFAISGYHKLFNADRHAALVATLKADGIPLLRFNAWFVPVVEFAAGVMLTLGLLSVIAALLLGAICLVATCCDGWARVCAYKPIDKADYVDDLLYLPEVLYGIMLLTVILTGPERYSLDKLILGL
jgi:putative oxidoreductase